jgi:hypothetical protein
MLAGPKQAISGPNEPPPVGPGHRGQLARLIRERPVFVNVAGCRIPDPSKRRNLREYTGFRGVFRVRVLVCHRAHLILNRQILSKTLAIRNLTGFGATRILKLERDRQKWEPVLRPIAL